MKDINNNRKLTAVISSADGCNTAEKLSKLLNEESINVYRADVTTEFIPRGSASLVIICDEGTICPAFGRIERIRRYCDLPIMTISENCDEMYRVIALNKGADMCLSAEELGRLEFSARVTALLRRYEDNAPEKKTAVPCTLVNGGISLDRHGREILSNGVPVKMTSTQFGIVEYLMENCGNVCTAEEIYQNVWHETPYSVKKNIVDHIRRIRKKIEPDPHHPRYIRSVSGKGYMMYKL